MHREKLTGALVREFKRALLVNSVAATFSGVDFLGVARDCNNTYIKTLILTTNTGSSRNEKQQVVFLLYLDGKRFDYIHKSRISVICN